MTKSELVDALEKILCMFTTKKEKETNNFQNDLEFFFKKYSNCKRMFNKKKIQITKSSHNYDLPLQSNENSKNSSLKEGVSEGKNFNFNTESPSYYNNANRKIETSNNLMYTPSNFESLSFIENLKDSKSQKKL